MFFIVSIGFLYLIIGFISLSIALLFTELGRPKDIIQSGLMILLGIFLIIYKNIFNFKISLIFTLNAVVISFYFLENFSYRWNQLLDKEKMDIKSFTGFIKNFSILYKIISEGFKNLFFNNKFKSILKNTSIKKKWVRKDDNSSNSSSKNSLSKGSMNNIQKADFSKEDIMNDVKNNTKNTKIDN